MAQYFVGVDLGQVRDPTTIAVLDTEGTLRLRHLERVPLRTPYADVVKRVRQLTRSRELAGRCRVVVDATGVGRPVVELLRTARLRCRLVPVMITAGKAESRDEGYYRVPKRDLIFGLDGLLRRRGLRIAPHLSDGPALLRELWQMRARVSGARGEQYGAWRRGEHDDLVFAVALACWGAKRAAGNRLG